MGNPLLPGGDPSWPPAANLTPEKHSGLGSWNETDFVRALREGIRKDGSEIHLSMPRTFGHFTDEEIKALWLYLQSVPVKKRGTH